MNVFTRLLTLCLAVFAVSAEAKTSKYELETPFSSGSGYVNYPRLDLFNAKSVVYTVNRNGTSLDAQLASLEITFPSAAKLTATNFKLVDNKYRAIVSGAWIYKEIIVEVEVPPFFSRGTSRINAYVSERTAFIDPQTDNQNPGGLLFSISGEIRDITPVRIVDNASIVIGGKKVTLSLRDRLQIYPGPWTGTYIPDGFVVDVLWYGRGTKSIYVQAPVPPPEFDAIEVIAIVLNGTTDFDRTISFKYKDRSGIEITTSAVLLKGLLDQAYGPVLAP